jgi:hypothetical protein
VIVEPSGQRCESRTLGLRICLKAVRASGAIPGSLFNRGSNLSALETSSGKSVSTIVWNRSTDRLNERQVAFIFGHTKTNDTTTSGMNSKCIHCQFSYMHGTHPINNVAFHIIRDRNGYRDRNRILLIAKAPVQKMLSLPHLYSHLWKPGLLSKSVEQVSKLLSSQSPVGDGEHDAVILLRTSLCRTCAYPA